MIAPGLRAIAERSAAHAGSVVLVAPLAGQHGVRHALGIDPDARIALVFRSKRIAQHGGALIAQIVLAAIVGGVPLAALQQHHAQAGDDSSLATMPPAAPAPTTTAFTRFMKACPFSVPHRRHRPAGDETVPHPSDVFVLVRWVGVRRTPCTFVLLYLHFCFFLGCIARGRGPAAQPGPACANSRRRDCRRGAASRSSPQGCGCAPAQRIAGSAARGR